MYRIRTYNQIADIGLSRFPRDRYEVGPAVESPQAFILRSQKLHGEPVPDSLMIGASVRALGTGHDLASDAGAALTWETWP